MKVAAAIADPVRREILEMLNRRPATAGAIADRFDISRPAISRHLRVLRECGLVHDDLIGRERRYTVDPEPLIEIVNWIAQFDGQLRNASAAHEWNQRLDALETEVARTRRSASDPKSLPDNSICDARVGARVGAAADSTKEIA